jgi:hypothetical protein
MDFFTVPTLTFGVLYCFFVIAHDRRRIVYCNVTKHPNSAWVVQQLREALTYIRFYHDDRTHLALAKGTPAGREAEKNTGSGHRVVSMPRLGGLHHRYNLAA